VDVETLSRWQFAITVIVHMTFPAITVGMSVLLSVTYGMYWRTKKPVYLQMFRFWRRIFAVGFALGVVMGIVMTFQFGLNWGIYASKTGPIIGPIIGMETVTAFFFEAAFIGVLLYGDGRVKHRTMFIATVVVAFGTLSSTTWILAANSWMQVPSGYTIENGQFVPVDWLEAIVSPSFQYRLPHLIVAVFLSAGLFVAGISAYYLVKRRALGFAKRSLSLALGVVAVLIPLQIALGDNVASQYIVPLQVNAEGDSPKLAAMEGNWDSTNTGFLVFIIPDQAEQRNLVEINLPWWGSAIGAKDFSGQSATPGLSEIPLDEQPNMGLTFWGFRIMFYASLLIFASAFIGTVLRLRHRLYDSTRFHKWLLWTTPIGILAIYAGWVTAEAGRQPWVVWGQLRTADSFSNLALGEVITSLVGFVVLYAVLLTAYVAYIVHTVRQGPDMKLTEPDSGAESPSEPIQAGAR